MTTPNQMILDFLNGLPEHTRDNIMTLGVMLSDQEAAVLPDTDWNSLASQSILPGGDNGPFMANHGAAVIWAGLLDYILDREVPAPSSEEMHKIADDFEAKHGHASPHMRSIADKQDQVNSDFADAGAAWKTLRAGELSNAALRRAWWLHRP